MGSLRVACIPALPLLQARLRDALGGPGAVFPFSEASAALPAILRTEVRCTVVAIDAATVAEALQQIRLLQQAIPSHPVVAWCERRGLSSRHILDIAQAGVTELVMRDVDDLRHVLGRILSSAMQRSHARRIEERVGDAVAEGLHALFRYALEHVHEPLDVARVAAGFGITRQTLRNRLDGAGMPSPRTFLTWCRLLVAGALLDEPGHTLDSVSWQLEFSSGHHLGTALRRYVGAGITELRESGVSHAVEAAFRDAMRASASLPDHSADH